MKYTSLPSGDHRGLSAHSRADVRAVHWDLVLAPSLGITSMIDAPASLRLMAWKQTQCPSGEKLAPPFPRSKSGSHASTLTLFLSCGAASKGQRPSDMFGGFGTD